MVSGATVLSCGASPASGLPSHSLLPDLPFFLSFSATFFSFLEGVIANGSWNKIGTVIHASDTVILTIFVDNSTTKSRPPGVRIMV